MRAPVNSFEFQPCGRTPQAECLLCLLRHGMIAHPTPSIHRLQRGLPGYLILFAPLALAFQRQMMSRKPPSPLVFLPISTHFTVTPGIPLTSLSLKQISFECSSLVKPRDFTIDLIHHLHALYTQSIRVTPATSVLPRLLARS